MKIAISILNYNGLDNTLDCLDSIKRLKKDNISLDVIVSDNNSQDNSTLTLSKLKDILFIPNEKNYGFAEGHNRAIKTAIKRRASAILILNNDTIVDENLLQSLMKTSHKSDIISPKIYFAPNYEFHKSRYKKNDLGKVIWYAGGIIDWDNILGKHIGVDEIDEGQYNERLAIDFATGAAMFVKREVFEKIGLFDERYFLYLEDMDFCVRAKKAGFKIMYEPKAIVWHKNAQSAQGSGSKLQDYYITRNRLLFAFKFAKLKTKIAVFKQTLLVWQNPIRRRALLDFLLNRFGKSRLNK